MKILQIIPQFVLPASDGGKIGIINISKEFSKNNEVTFIFFSNFSPDQYYIDEINKLGKAYFIIKDIRNSLKNIAISIVKNKPVYLSKFVNSNIYKQLDAIIKNIKFDVIHADHTSMAQIAYYISKKTNKPWGLRLHNLEHIIWSRYAHDLKNYDLRKPFLLYQSQLLKLKELQYIKDASISFPITYADDLTIKKYITNPSTVVAGAGVDLELNKAINIKKNPFQLCIATTYNWIHNVDGLIWFIENVLTLIKKEIPEVKLNLYGKNIPNELKKYEQLGVKAIGFVDDISKELSQSSVYIAPLFVGSGVRIKIIEALAHSLPVVATKVSAEGININEGNGLFITDSPQEQAQIILSLLQNSEKTQNLGLKARKYVEQNYSWQKSVSIMLNEYYKLI